VQFFYREVASFTKNGDKFGWVKYWRITFSSPNSKFSPATILRYTVFSLQTGGSLPLYMYPIDFITEVVLYYSVWEIQKQITGT